MYSVLEASIQFIMPGVSSPTRRKGFSEKANIRTTLFLSEDSVRIT